MRAVLLSYIFVVAINFPQEASRIGSKHKTSDLSDLNEWMKRFQEEPVFFNGVEHEDQDLNLDKRQLKRKKKLHRMKYVYSSKTRLFPATRMMILAMYKLMKLDGILEKEGFSRAGWIRLPGEANIIFARPFRNAKTLLRVLDSSSSYRLSDQEVAVGLVDEDKPIPALTNYLLTRDERERLRAWIQKLTTVKDFKLRGHLADSKLHIIIFYRCCYKGYTAPLMPKFARLSVKVG